MRKTSNIHARQFVKDHEEFQGNNLHGDIVVRDGTAMYCVWSYGYWPLFVYVAPVEKWYENTDRYSVTTSKHRSQTHPHCDTVRVNRAALTDLINRGADALPEIAAMLKVSP
jgi:hypothetical protein